ncbi:MAG: SPOR domain-containing protein [Pacificimonas sp.]|jgi:hypothetical protein|nr:SPOR domain-containing protein [Pacificimonas sp.]
MIRKGLIALAMGALLAVPARADVADGVAEWRAGNYREAVMLWLPAAARGNSHALFNLGLAYRQGRGVPRDLDRAEDFFKRAAEKGHAPARTYLGIFHVRRNEVARAVELWQQSAQEGDAHARYMLGIRHFSGRGVPVDRPRAYGYMLLADNAGLTQARRPLRRMEAALSEQEKADGRMLAEQLSGAPLVTLADAGAEASPAERAAASVEQERAEAAVAAVRTVNVPPPGQSVETVRANTGDDAPVLASEAVAFRVQLGAYGSRAAAETGWAQIQSANAALFDSTTPVFRTFESGVRLRVGDFAQRAAASAYCEQIKAAGQACFVAAED